MNIVYQLNSDSWNGYPKKIQELINTFKPIHVCDVGGGANPILSIEYIQQHKLEYSILDKSDEELQKAPLEYKKVLLNIEDPNINISNHYDLILSCMVAEHIKDAYSFHSNVFNILSPGGIVFHYFPTLFALPFFINKILPDQWSEIFLNFFAPRNRRQRAKFPAYYRWTFGPTSSQITRFTSIGYEILEYRGFFGNKYYDRLPIIRNIHYFYSKFLLSHPNPYFTSYAYLIMQKPR
jgi:2-polyprenyl-3-methyl-5-hydroxy-6-metoxy-1,4-benzoquinol methylase